MGVENQNEVFPKKVLRYTLIAGGLLVLAGLAANSLPKVGAAIRSL